MTSPASHPTADPSERTLSLARVFDAPRSLVYSMWSNPDHLRRWCAPRGFTIPHGEGELRPGGVWRTCMRSPDGVDYWLGGVYREVVPDSRIVFTHQWDEDGRPGHETLVTLTFEDADQGRTRLQFRQTGFRSLESLEGHRGGWEETFDNLAAYLAEVNI